METTKKTNFGLQQVLPLNISDIYERIISCNKEDEKNVLDIITSMPGFTPYFIDESKKAFQNREVDYSSWLKYKIALVEYIITIKSYANISSNEEKTSQRINK